MKKRAGETRVRTSKFEPVNDLKPPDRAAGTFAIYRRSAFMLSCKRNFIPNYVSSCNCNNPIPIPIPIAFAHQLMQELRVAEGIPEIVVIAAPMGATVSFERLRARHRHMPIALVLVFLFTIGILQQSPVQIPAFASTAARISCEEKIAGNAAVTLLEEKRDWRMYGIEEAAAAVGKFGGTVIVCTVSTPFWSMLENWLISVQKQGREKAVLVFAEDEPTLFFVNERWPGHAVMDGPPPSSNTTNNFKTEGFYNFTARRPQHLLRILELGYNVLYNDVDLVWKQDLLTFFPGNHDIYFADDSRFAKETKYSNTLQAGAAYPKGSWICSCVLFIRPSLGGKLIVRRWIHEVLSTPPSERNVSNDQTALNKAIRSTVRKVDFYLLPQVAFPPGALYFGNSTWRLATEGMQAIVHNNFIIGVDKKIKRFRMFGLWFLDTIQDHSLLGSRTDLY